MEDVMEVAYITTKGQLVVPADQALAELAGEIKASYKMSLADCFAAALAKLKKLELYTGDPEFKAIESEIKIVWI